MSDTPRTDAYTVSRSISLLENGVVHYIIELFVTREFARQLERELNDEREKVRVLKEKLASATRQLPIFDPFIEEGQK